MGEVLTLQSFAGLRVEQPLSKVPTVNILLYGKPGVGKTRLAGTADDVPEMRKVLFIDVEGGTFTLRKSNPNCDVIRIKTWPELQGLYNELHRGAHDYRTVVLDSLTELQKLDMYYILAELTKGERASGKDIDEDIASVREWGRSIEHIRKLVRGFRDLPMNVIFTAHQKEDKDKKGKITIKPSLPGKLADEVAGFLDVVLYMYVKNIDGEEARMLLSTATDEHIAKDRSDSLPQVIQNPTMTSLFELITS